MVLTAEGLTVTSWKRPLRFAEVGTVQLQRVNAAFQVKFNLKERQKSISKWALPTKVKAIVLPISPRMNEKPLVMAQTIFRYYVRQPEGEGEPS